MAVCNLKWSDVTTIWIERPHPFFVAEYFYEYTGKDAITTVVFVVFIFLFGKWYWGHGTIPNDGRKIGLILILWIVLSYFIPYLRSTYSASLLQPRYTMVTLPAWFILFAIGWNEIRNRWKYILPILIVLSFIVNMMFFKQHYTRIEKDQFREVSEYVISNNVHHYPICSSLPWHLNFYFRNQPEKVEDIHHTDLASIDMFWLLQAHINEQQQAWEDAVLDGKFVVVERHTFFGANALLMKRK